MRAWEYGSREILAEQERDARGYEEANQTDDTHQPEDDMSHMNTIHANTISDQHDIDDTDAGSPGPTGPYYSGLYARIFQSPNGIPTPPAPPPGYKLDGYRLEFERITRDQSFEGTDLTDLCEQLANTLSDQISLCVCAVGVTEENDGHQMRSRYDLRRYTPGSNGWTWGKWEND